jgi:hypothetical protein
MKQVTNTAPPSNVIAAAEVGVSSLIGVKHKNFDASSKPKKYKAHQRADTGEIELIGFLNSTGHLNETDKFDTMQAVFNYCTNKGHSMYVFDTPQEMGAWLAE